MSNCNSPLYPDKYSPGFYQISGYDTTLGYCGPGVMRDAAGKVRIRMDQNPLDQFQRDGITPIPDPISQHNPNNQGSNLILSINGRCFLFGNSSSYITLRNLDMGPGPPPYKSIPPTTLLSRIASSYMVSGHQTARANQHDRPELRDPHGRPSMDLLG